MRSLAFILLFITGLAISARAQFSIEGGVGFDNLSLKMAGQKVGTTFATGGAFGILAGLAVADNIYFEPGLYYKTAGCKYKDAPDYGFSISTITIPLDLVYKTGTKCAARSFVGAGLFIAKNLSGTGAAIVPGGAENVDLKIGTGSDASLKPTDIGFNVTAGHVFGKHFGFRVRYQMGMVNLFPSGNSDNSMKTSSISLTLGYTAGGCRQRGGGGLFGSRGGNHWQGMSKAKWSRRDRHARYPQ